MQFRLQGGRCRRSEIEWRAGDLDAQERILREALGFSTRSATSSLLDGLASTGGRLLLTQIPDDDEVARICTAARERSLEGDSSTTSTSTGRSPPARIPADRAARRWNWRGGGGTTADTTDNFDARSHAWYAFAETLLLAGEADEARTAAATSIEIRTAKGDVAGAAALERRYAELDLAIA